MGKIAVIGSGLIGRSWAMLFASGGHHVSLFDVVPAQLETAQNDICENLRGLENSGKLRGTLSVEEQVQLIAYTDSLEDCLSGAIYVQECVPEILDLKKKVFSQLDAFATDEMILASSSSAIPCSQFTQGMRFAHRTLVAHPVNPPYFMPLVELVPSPATDPEVVTKARQLLKDIGQSPITLKKEIPGFIQPRIQFAIIQEALKLVADGVVSAADVDTAVTEGLAFDYAFMGPFEMAHLQAEGMRDYLDRHGDSIYKVSSDFAPAIHLKGNPLLDTVDKELREKIPLDKLSERRKWRDDHTACLSQIRTNLDTQDKQ